MDLSWLRREATRLDNPAVPTVPGVYVVFCDSPLGALNWSPIQGPAYAGKADGGLQGRITRTHLGDTGRSTLRRTYGALLREELDLRAIARPSGGPPKGINYTNYNFEARGDRRLTGWMMKHLTVLAMPSNRPGHELELIDQFAPPLNLTGWQNPWRMEIKALRRICADEARGQV